MNSFHYFSFYGYWLCFNSIFVLLVGILTAIGSSVVGLNICGITAGMKGYKSIINKKKHDKIALLEKTKSSSIEVLISMALINSDISHGDFVSVNTVLIEYNNIKKTIKILRLLI